MDDEDAGMGIPEWVVTFGDMMSLLLTFFIMLVSMSELKEDEKFQATVDAIQQEFGYQHSSESISPGSTRPRTTAYRPLATISRAKRTSTHAGGAPTQAPQGDNERVRIIRPGQQTAIGTVLFYKDGAIELSDENKKILEAEVSQFVGKPQKIEIRGHTSHEANDLGANALEPMDLAYKRCRAVMNHLVETLEIPAKRIRMSTAGSNEPMSISTDPTKLKMNPRVEVFLLEETVDELVGTPEDRDEKFLDALSSDSSVH